MHQEDQPYFKSTSAFRTRHSSPDYKASAMTNPWQHNTAVDSTL